MKKEKSLVSIIIPTYNNQDTIGSVLENAINQTYTNIEIIAVNDGSTDETKRICLDYARNDARIKLLENDKKNGAGYSRNRGLESAKGKYVLFFDADDSYDEFLIEKVTERIEKDDSDICIFGYKTHEIYSDDTSVHDYKNQIVEKADSNTLRKASWAPWNKIFRRNFLVHHSITFQNIPNANDLFFSCISIINANRISFLEGCYVKYEEGQRNSITDKRNNQRDYTVHGVNCFFEYLINNEIDIQPYKEYINYLIDILAKAYFKKEKTIECRRNFIEDWNELEVSKKCKVLMRKDEYYPHIHIFIELLNSNHIADYTQYYELFSSQIERIYNSIKGEEVVLWGFGIQGIELYNFLKKKDYRIDCVIDKDENKKRKSACINIYTPKYVEGRNPFILLANSLYYDEIYSMTKSERIICLDKQ